MVGTCHKDSGFINVDVDSEALHHVVDVSDGDRTFALAIPLIEDFLEVASCAVFSSYDPSNFFDFFQIHLSFKSFMMYIPDSGHLGLLDGVRI